MLLLLKILQTTNEVVEVVKHIVVTTYDEPVFYCFGWNVRGGEGYITRQVQCRGGPVFLSPVLTNFSGSSCKFPVELANKGTRHDIKSPYITSHTHEGMSVSVRGIRSKFAAVGSSGRLKPATAGPLVCALNM